MTAPEQRVVSVFGGNSAAAGGGACATAQAVGRRLAELGYVVANGGYGGTMAAAARGAAEAGGSTIGVTCSIWRSRPNPYIDRVVETASLAERLHTLVELGTGGYVVLPGATGTLLELATVWELQCKGLMPRRPLVCVGRFWRPLVKMMASARPGAGEMVTMVDKAENLDEYFPRQSST